MLFDFLRDIISLKRGDLLENAEDEAEFVPYLIQRWLSMTSSSNARILNHTTNSLYSVLETKQDWYKVFLVIIPQQFFKKIDYIKKTKDPTKKEDKEVIARIAKTRQLSQREVELYLDDLGININQMKNVL